ncbi:transcriptional regulator [Ruegeria sp.]|uniref:transcriptional regulator n=1 Tax=Ruegeria sp. TaxID=1879320 RepID=UPI00230A332D|nr:transcriptional regulator [Ruegeria sp.]MDA7963476.1 transcriptional regulator [Ruegeria sp.]
MAEKADILNQIQDDLPELSRALRCVAEFLLANPTQFIRQPLRELSETVGVSEPSLIRFGRRYGFKGLPDLRIAVAMAMAARESGSSAELEPTIRDKEVVNKRAKRAVAALAARLIADDQSILLDSGSTVQFMADHLREASPKVLMTTGLNLMLALHECPQHQLMLTGGVLRQNSMSLSGRLVETTLEGMSFDTVLLGADRVDPSLGLSTFSEEEAHLNRAMIRASRRVIVLADAGKFGATKLHRICDLSKVDAIVSDASMPEDMRQELRDKNVELHLAQVPDAA